MDFQSDKVNRLRLVQINIIAYRHSDTMYELGKWLLDYNNFECIKVMTTNNSHNLCHVLKIETTMGHLQATDGWNSIKFYRYESVEKNWREQITNTSIQCNAHQDDKGKNCSYTYVSMKVQLENINWSRSV